MTDLLSTATRTTPWYWTVCESMMDSGITLRHAGTRAKWSYGWTMDRDRWGCIQNVCWIQITASAWLWTGNLELKLSLAFWSVLRVVVFGYCWLRKVVFLVNTLAAFGYCWLIWKVVFLVNTLAAFGHCWLLCKVVFLVNTFAAFGHCWLLWKVVYWSIL